jgi:acyl carrier protein
MTKSELYAEIEGILDVKSGSIRGDERLADTGRWDSLSAVMFMAMASEKLGQEISPGDLAKCSTVADLEALFGNKVQ